MTDYRVHVIGADHYFIKAVYLDFADAEAAIESTKFKPSSGATVVRSLSPKTAVTVPRARQRVADRKPLDYVATRDLVADAATMSSSWQIPLKKSKFVRLRKFREGQF